MTANRIFILGWALLTIACNDEQKPTASGDRIDLTTKIVTQVCQGTIEQLDFEIEQLEAELELGPMSRRINLHIVDSTAIAQHCELNRGACVVQSPRRLVMTPTAFVRAIRYELVRERLAETPVGSTKPLLFEGTAGALTWPSCAPTQAWLAPSAGEALAATTRASLGSEGRYLGGEWVRWLIDTHGPTAVLEFMAEIDRHTNTVEIRAAYSLRFGGLLDVDLFAHWRPDDAPVPRARSGVTAPENERDEARSRIVINADFDCGSPLVRNDFTNPERVFIEWTMTVPPDSNRYTGLGELPEGVEITFEACDCLSEYWSEWMFESSIKWMIPNKDLYLKPGVYRVRAYAPIGTVLNYEIAAPCDFIAQNCPDGQQCLPWNTCEDEVPNPAQLDESCMPQTDGDDPHTCDGGLACVGPQEGLGACLAWCDDGTDASCPDQTFCTVYELCARPCDPLDSTCESGWGCMPDFELEGKHSCLPVGDAGLHEPCNFVFGTDCVDGLFCMTNDTIPGCNESRGWFETIGCCTPICDPHAADPGCPAELPTCETYDNPDVGVCVE